MEYYFVFIFFEGIVVLNCCCYFLSNDNSLVFGIVEMYLFCFIYFVWVYIELCGYMKCDEEVI